MDTSFSLASLQALLPVAVLLGKATAVLLVALLLTLAMQRASATARHLVWVATLFALVVLPVLSRFSPIRLPLLPAAFGAAPALAASVGALTAPDAARIVNDGARQVPGAAPTPVVASTAEPLTPVVPQAPQLGVSLPVALGLVWALVAACIAGWLLWGMRAVRRIVRSATPLDGAEWHGPLMDIADRLELADVPRLLRSESVTMPFACGLRTPTIVLPADSATWSDERRTAVLLHELAHIRRRDLVGHTLARVACALYWFHPLVWTVARRLRVECERACDDLALACGTRPSDYAEHLLDIVTSVRTHGTPSVAMAMATRSEFEGRMLAILDPHLVRSAPTRMQASTLAGGVMMFAIVTGAAVPRGATPSGGEPPATNQVATATRDTSIAHDTSDVPADERDRPTVARVRTESPSDSMPENVAAVTRLEARLPEIAVTASAVDSSARAVLLARILSTDTAATLRRTAAWALNDFTATPAALDALLAAVRRDPSASVREMAAWSLAYAGEDARVAAALSAAVRDERDATVRKTAVWALSESADGNRGGVIEALSSVLTDDDAGVRELAAWGIGNAGPKRAPAAVIAALADRDAHVRATAAWALFQIEDGDAAAALERALQKETDQDARWSMVRAISVMGERAVAPLQRIIEGSDAAARALAIRSLAGRGADPWPQPRPQPRPFP